MQEQDKHIQVGIFESDDFDYSAVVVYISETERHVTVWKDRFKVIGQYMTKAEWESVRDEKGLIMTNIQSAEYPLF